MSDTAGASEPSQPASAGGGAPAADAPVEEVKDKFRQALERKRGHQADREASADHLGGSKIGGEHASAKTKRTFRRKSG